MPDLFNPVAPHGASHRLFRAMATDRAHAPARCALQQAYDLLPSPDKNFIRDFQTTGFSARVWELYLGATTNSMGFTIEQPEEQPDFLLTKDGTSFWIEATTANPTDGTPPATFSPSPQIDEQAQWVIKMAGALYSKLRMRYWDRPHVAGLALVLAIEDFQNDDPFRMMAGPLIAYLYGKRATVKQLSSGATLFEEAAISMIAAGAKTIPAPFFDLPDAEHISGVLWSNAGTVPKFNRMAYSRPQYPDLLLHRFGFAHDAVPDSVSPEPFSYIVGEAPEQWGQEAMLFHNPNARHPLNRALFDEIAQYQVTNGELYFRVPEFFPMMSLTRGFIGTPATIAKLETVERELGRAWVLHAHKRRDSIDQKIIADLNTPQSFFRP